MITDAHRKEGLSMAFMQALAAQAGLNVGFGQGSFDYGIDGAFHEVREVGGRRIASGFKVDFQLKATTRWTESEGRVTYDLAPVALERLQARLGFRTPSPMLLVVLLLPEEPGNWSQTEPDGTLLRRCCVWKRVDEECCAHARQVFLLADCLTAQALREILDEAISTS